MRSHFLYNTIYYVADIAPTPTEAICKHFNELRSDLALALDLKNALVACEFDLQALRHQYEALNPGKVCSLPEPLCYTFLCLSKNWGTWSKKNTKKVLTPRYNIS